MTETKPSIQYTLIKLGACSDAREWAEGKTWPEIFETCHRGDWLLWLLGPKIKRPRPIFAACIFLLKSGIFRK